MGYLNVNLYSPVAAVFFLSLSFAWFFIKKKLTPHQLPLPPGPKGLPFLGSAFEINKSKPWLTYEEWKNSYGASLCKRRVSRSSSLGILGEIVSCKLLGQAYIILNSDRVVKALLDQRSTIYSERPVLETSKL